MLDYVLNFDCKNQKLFLLNSETYCDLFSVNQGFDTPSLHLITKFLMLFTGWDFQEVTPQDDHCQQHLPEVTETGQESELNSSKRH